MYTTVSRKLEVNMLKMSEIKSLDKSAIETKVSELRKELFNLGFERQTSGLEKTHLISEKRKDIARLLTALNMNKSE